MRSSFPLLLLSLFISDLVSLSQGFLGKEESIPASGNVDDQEHLEGRDKSEGDDSSKQSRPSYALTELSTESAQTESSPTENAPTESPPTEETQEEATPTEEEFTTAAPDESTSEELSASTEAKVQMPSTVPFYSSTEVPPPETKKEVDSWPAVISLATLIVLLLICAVVALLQRVRNSHMYKIAAESVGLQEARKSDDVMTYNARDDTVIYRNMDNVDL